MAETSYDRGAERMAELHPGLSTALEQSLAPIAPDFARWMVEFGYGEVLTRPGLDPARRQLVTLGALAALGHSGDQLRGHIGAGLKAGLTPAEITEALMQVALYAGFPAATNALRIAKQVFAERGVSPLDAAQSSSGDR